MKSQESSTSSIVEGTTRYVRYWTYDVGVGSSNRTQQMITIAFEVKKASADEYGSQKRWIMKTLEPEEKTRLWFSLPTESIGFYKRVGITRIRIGPSPQSNEDTFVYDEENEPRISFYKALKLNTFLTKKTAYRIIGMVGLPLLLILLVYSCVS